MSVSEEVRQLIEDTLKADAQVSALVGSRVYDGAPPIKSRTYPDITFGANDYTPEDYQCIFGRDETFQLDCWTREHGRKAQCRDLVDAVKAALHEADLTLTVNALVRIRVVLVRVFNDPDGLTTHGVVQVTADVEEAS